MIGRVPAVAFVVTALVVMETVAFADVIARGHLVRVEDREIYFTLGSPKRLAAGNKLRIKRPIKLRHPVTKKMVEDWLPIGSATVTVVGHQLSMARLDKPLVAQVRVGDWVEVLVPGPDPSVAVVPVAPTPTPTPAPEPPSGRPPSTPPGRTADPAKPALDPGTARVIAAWRASAGKSLAARIVIWEQYLQRAPDDTHAAAVRENIKLLRRYRDELQPPELTLGARRIRGLAHTPATRTPRDEPLELVFVVDEPRSLIAAWLHYRTVGVATFARAPLQADGDGYLRGRIPAATVTAPGVEYFVEAAVTGGSAGSAIGSATAPITVKVEPPPLAASFEQRPHQSRVSFATTYLDFATFDERDGDRTDRFVLVEADFFYRLRKIVYGIRAGFGVFNGRGGFANRDYPNGAPRVGFNFGYAELEFRGPYQTAWMTRLVAGVGRDGFGTGLDVRFRLGDEERTNLTVGVESIAEIGFLAEMRMQWNAMPDFPLGVAVGATDQPGQGDVGVRLTTDLGWRALDWVTPTLRVSYQARTVDHAGIGAGIGMVFDW